MSRDGRGGVLQCRSPPDPKGGATWQEEIPERHEQIQTWGFSKQSQRSWQAPTPTRQKHGCLAECMQYYNFRYSTICYGISVFLCARYNVSPVNLQSHCDGCGTAFGVTHALICSIGGLFIARHKTIRDKFLYLYRRAFTSAYVRPKPLIHQGCTIFELEIRQGSDNHKDTRGGRDNPKFMISSSRRHHLRQVWWLWCGYVQVQSNDITPGQVGKDQEIQAR